MSAPAATVGPAPARKPLRNVRPTAWARLLHNPMAAFGLVLLAVIVAVVLLAPVVPLQSPDTVHIAQRLNRRWRRITCSAPISSAGISCRGSSGARGSALRSASSRR